MKCRERDIYHSINHPDWNRYYIAIGEINQCTYEMKGITEEEREKVYFKRRVTRVNNLFRKTIKEFSYERCNLFIISRKTALYKTKVYFYTNGRILLLRYLKPILKRFYHLPYLEGLVSSRSQTTLCRNQRGQSQAKRTYPRCY